MKMMGYNVAACGLTDDLSAASHIHRRCTILIIKTNADKSLVRVNRWSRTATWL